MKRQIQQILCGVGATILGTMLVFGSALPVRADAAHQGTLTIVPKTNNGVVSDYDGTFNVYKVADYVPETETLTVVAPFTSYTGTPAIAMKSLYFDDATTGNDSTFRKLVDALGDYYNGLETKPDIVTDATGNKAEGVEANTNLTLNYGLYLIAQATKGSGYKECKPFLVILPEQTGAVSNASVTAYSKLEVEETPTPPTPPETPGNPPDNPPPTTPPTTPPETPPDTPEDEGGEETPPTPGEDIGNMDDSGNMNENGEINEVGGLTGDNSQMVTYAVVAGAAVVILGGWFIWKRKKDRKES